MPRTSLDGRGRKASDSPSSGAGEQGKLCQPRRSFPTNLKEASPPKTNPWGKIKPLSSKPLPPGMPSPQKQSPEQPLSRQSSPTTPSPETTSPETSSPKQLVPKQTSPKTPPLKKPSPKTPSPKYPSCEVPYAKNQAPNQESLEQKPARKRCPEPKFLKKQSPEQRCPTSDTSPLPPDHDATPRPSHACYASFSERRVSPTSSPRKDSHPKGKAPATFEEPHWHSASPSSSRALFQAAAPRAGQSLWDRPFGADVFVHVGNHVLQVHRNILVPRSGWFRDRLPAPSPGGAPVEVLFPGEAKIVSHSLKFLYTGRLEPCEFDNERPHDITNIACCSLFYLSAVDLRAKAMACHVITLLEHTAKKWWEFLDAHFTGRYFGQEQGAAFWFHLRNALDAAYGHPEQHAVGPLRLALAGFLDVVLPLIVRQPTVIDLLCSRTWQRFSGAITADLVEFRRRKGGSQAQAQRAAMYDETTMEALLESTVVARGGVAGSSKEPAKF